MAESVPLLSLADVETHSLFLTTWLNDNFPEIDTSVGSVFHDLLIVPAVAFRALERDNINDVRDTQSLLQISSDPDLASNEIVDNIMSNFNVTRVEGTATTGVVTVKLDRDVTTIIPVTASFAYESHTYIPTNTFTAVSSISLVDSDTDRLIKTQPNGDYFITIPVVAEEVNDGDALKKGTILEFTSISQNIIGIVAYEDFKSGVLTEDNEAIIDRLEDGITAKVLSGRSHIVSLLNTELGRKVPITVIGFGDLEMSRDSNNLFNISHGGRVDCYLKTHKTLLIKQVELTATVTNSITNELTLTVPYDAYPGYYFVKNIFRLDNPNTLYIPDAVVTTSVTAPEYDYTPYMRFIDYNFSVFKEAVVTFTDPQLGGLALNGDTITYGVSLPGQPDLAALQVLVSGQDSRNPSADYLIKPAIPFEVSITLSIHYKNTVPDTDAIKDMIIDNVDKISLDSSTLAASLIIDSCHDFLEHSDYVVTPIDMAATGYLPDGSTVSLRSGTALRIATSSALGVSGRTACFFVSKDTITIDLVQESTI